MRKTYFLMGALLIGALVCSISVVADEEPNGTQDDAEEVDDGDDIEGTVIMALDEDWYVVELLPLEKLTVEIELTTGLNVIVRDYLEGEDDVEGEISIDINELFEEKKDSYTNTAPTMTKLYLRISGIGGYELKITVGKGYWALCGCCFSSCCGMFLILLLVLLVIIVMKRKKDRR